MTVLYFLGICVGVLVALLLKNTIFKGEAVPFVMELPNYRLPGIKNVSQLLWDKAKDFLQKAFSVILIATCIVWFLQSFDIKLNPVTDSSGSIMAALSGLMVPIFKPIGLGDWRIITSLISGFMAKESVVATLEMLYGNTIVSSFSISQVMSLLVFSLLYTPCVAAVAAIRRELGRKYAVAVVVFQCAIAWLCALLTYGLCWGILSK